MVTCLTGRLGGGIAALTLLACAPPPRAAPSAAAEQELARIRSAAEALLAARTEQQWRAWALGETSDAAPPPDDAWLVAPATIDRVRRAVRRAVTPDERRAALALHRLLVWEHLQRALMASTERRVALEATVSSAAPVTLAGLPAALAGEPDPLRRRVLAESFQGQLEELAALQRERGQRLAATARRLGYTSHARLVTTLRGYPIAEVATLADALLETTAPLWHAALAELAPARCALPAAEIGRPDLARLQPLVDLPADQTLAPTVQASLAGAGLLAGGGVHLDVQPRPGKNPRAATFPLRLPGDVRVSLSPSGTLNDAAILLHELGHALHFAHTRVPLFELAQLGDGSVAEGFAFLFESLADDGAYLRATFALDEPLVGELRRAAGAWRLLTTRRHAARLLFALEHWQRPQRDPAALFADHFARALGVPIDEADAWWWPVELEDWAESADYLRGQLFAAALAAELDRRFGAPWWQQPAAGAWLIELWASGQRDPLEVVLARLGRDTLPLEPFVTACAEALAHDPSLAGPRR